MCNITICRVCLSIDRRMCAVTDTVLQKMWEKLTNTNFNTIDGKPVFVCYICCAQLTRSHQLMRRALKAEELLTTFISNGLAQSKELISMMASQLNEFEYNCNIEHQASVEIRQYEINREEEIKEEREQMIDTYIKEEVGGISDDSHLEVHADNDPVSGKHADNDLPLKHMSLRNLLERKVELNFPKVAIGKPANIHNPTSESNLDVSATISNMLNTEHIVNTNVNNENKDSGKVICVEDLMKSIEGLDSSKLMAKKRKKYTRKCVTETSYKCDICQFVGAHKYILNSHMRKHTGEKPYLCELCDYKSAVRSALKIHINRVHKKEKNFSCDICEYVCFQKFALKNHMVTHTGEKPYLCQLCDHRAAHSNSLKKHMMSKHNEGVKDVSCHICEYKCVTKGRLDEHLRKHTGEKPHMCDLCDYKASFKSNLRNHILYKHSNKRDFTCLICEWKCVRKYDLDLHIRKHTGEKPFVCDYCGHNMSSKSNLLKHMKHKHSN